MNLVMITIIVLAVLALLIYLYLPAFLRLLGIHRHYTIPDFDMKGKRALMICTNHNRLDPLKRDTGAFGSEFTVPYYAFVNAGMDVDMASPKGGEIPIQPGSWSWPLACHDDKRFMKDNKAMHDLKNSKAISDLEPNDYDVIFMAGGWGAGGRDLVSLARGSAREAGIRGVGVRRAGGGSDAQADRGGSGGGGGERARAIG